MKFQALFILDHCAKIKAHSQCIILLIILARIIGIHPESSKMKIRIDNKFLFFLLSFDTEKGAQDED
jgi:hypothetical protein